MITVNEEVLQEESWYLLLMHLIELTNQVGEIEACHAIAYKYYDLLNKAKLEEISNLYNEVFFTATCGLVEFIWDVDISTGSYFSELAVIRSPFIVFTPEYYSMFTLNDFINNVSEILVDLLHNSEYYL